RVYGCHVPRWYRRAQVDARALGGANGRQDIRIALGAGGQLRGVARLLLLVRHLGQDLPTEPLELTGEDLGEALAIGVVRVHSAGGLEALLLGELCQDDTLRRVRDGGAEQEVIVVGVGQRGRRGRRGDLHDPGPPGYRLRDRESHAAGGGADDGAH